MLNTEIMTKNIMAYAEEVVIKIKLPSNNTVECYLIVYIHYPFVLLVPVASRKRFVMAIF